MDAAVIKRTQDLLGPYVKAPPLADKFLQKPPLRFLHDVFVNVSKEHGLMEGLFDEDELDWTDAVANNKDAKAFFIAKVVSYVSIAAKTNLDLKPARVCAGQDADKTNQLLQIIAGLLGKATDNGAVIEKIKAGKGAISLTEFPKGAAFLKTNKPGKPETAARKPQPALAHPETKKREASPAKSSAQPQKQPVATPANHSGPALKPIVEKPAAAAKIPASRNLHTVEELKNEPENLTAAAPHQAPTVEKPVRTRQMDVAAADTTKPAAEKALSPTREQKILSVATVADASSKTIAKVPVQARPPSARPTTAARPNTAARPTTARRAPQRPPTATIRSRQNSIAGELSDNIPPPPSNVKFLADDADESVLDMGTTRDQDMTAESSVLDYFVNPSNAEPDDSDGLVAKLRSEQKRFLDEQQINEAESTVNPMTQQESVRFSAEVDELCTALQKISRLTDMLSKYMEMLPEDLEDMERDKQRYQDEYQSLQEQIESAFKREDEQLEKLRREQAFQEESVFAIGEEIASVQFRIKEKTELLDRILRLRS